MFCIIIYNIAFNYLYYFNNAKFCVSFLFMHFFTQNSDSICLIQYQIKMYNRKIDFTIYRETKLKKGPYYKPNLTIVEDQINPDPINPSTIKQECIESKPCIFKSLVLNDLNSNLWKVNQNELKNQANQSANNFKLSNQYQIKQNDNQKYQNYTFQQYFRIVTGQSANNMNTLDPHPLCLNGSFKVLQSDRNRSFAQSNYNTNQNNKQLFKFFIRKPSQSSNSFLNYHNVINSNNDDGNTWKSRNNNYISCNQKNLLFDQVPNYRSQITASLPNQFNNQYNPYLFRSQYQCSSNFIQQGQNYQNNLNNYSFKKEDSWERILRMTRQNQKVRNQKEDIEQQIKRKIDRQYKYRQQKKFKQFEGNKQQQEKNKQVQYRKNIAKQRMQCFKVNENQDEQKNFKTHQSQTTDLKMKDQVRQRLKGQVADIYVSSERLPKCNNFNTSPSIQQLSKYTKQQLTRFKNFQIWNKFGRVRFLSSINLLNLNIDNIITIQQNAITIQPQKFKFKVAILHFYNLGGFQKLKFIQSQLQLNKKRTIFYRGLNNFLKQNKLSLIEFDEITATLKVFMKRF